jgi:hypothetical protein
MAGNPDSAASASSPTVRMEEIECLDSMCMVGVFFDQFSCGVCRITASRPSACSNNAAAAQGARTAHVGRQFLERHQNRSLRRCIHTFNFFTASFPLP